MSDIVQRLTEAARLMGEALLAQLDPDDLQTVRQAPSAQAAIGASFMQAVLTGALRGRWTIDVNSVRCPLCGGFMQVRNRKDGSGQFLGCVAFNGGCRGARNAPDGSISAHMLRSLPGGVDPYPPQALGVGGRGTLGEGARVNDADAPPEEDDIPF